jgi:hypothetical protein
LLLNENKVKKVERERERRGGGEKFYQLIN